MRILVEEYFDNPLIKSGGDLLKVTRLLFFNNDVSLLGRPILSGDLELL